MTDFRALCAELADRLQRAITSSKADRFYGEDRDALDRARAALAQPEPQGPTNEELLKLIADKFGYEPTLKVGFQEVYGTTEEMVSLLRAVLARWSCPTTELVPVAEGLPGPEDCDAEGRCWLLYRSASVNRTPTWSLVHRRSILDADYTHWLPHWALLVPKSNSITQGE